MFKNKWLAGTVLAGLLAVAGAAHGRLVRRLRRINRAYPGPSFCR